MTNTLPQQVHHWIEHLDLSQRDHLELIHQACVFASMHEKTDTPFSLSTLIQGLAMADVLLALQCDSTAIAAAIIYPAVFYDKKLTEMLSEKFDHVIYKIITGAIHMETVHEIHYLQTQPTQQQKQMDNIRKMLLSMVDDIRTILIKLADRLIILKNLEKTPRDIQQKIAQETMDYYAPLANRLGIGQVKWQLEDWAFRYLNPAEFQKIANAFHMKHEDRVKLVHQMIVELKKMLSKNNLHHAKISGRIKHIYSIYRKIQRKKVGVKEIYDTSAIRILLPTVQDCYAALSVVHARWQPIAKEFDDYIAKPKKNGYQSIHTAIISDNNTPVEIQLRTIDMHEKAELGIAAHWKYKENKSVTEKDEEKIFLLRELLDWQQNISTEEEQKKLYHEAFHDYVYVFSPVGEVFSLPKGATPIDFAYLVHTQIGHRCRGAKLNGALVPLTYQLKTGDRIDIVTAKEAHPSRDWVRPELGFLKTPNAIRKVKNWFYKQDIEKTEIKSHETEKEIKSTATKAVIEAPDDRALSSATDFSVQGAKHFLTQLAQCCHPIPGDKIKGYITQGRGISVHQAHCSNVLLAMKNKPERLVDISWETQHKQKQKKYRVQIEAQGEDRPGLLRDISGAITKMDLSILSIHARLSAENNNAILILVITVPDLAKLSDILKKIKQVKGVSKVVRK